MVPVHHNVWISDVLGISNHQSAVLGVCAEYPCRSHQGEYRTLPLLGMTTSSENDLVQATLILKTLRQKHGKVLVCYALDYGRSAVAMLTWLLVCGGYKDLTQVKAELKQVRPRMVLSPTIAQAVGTAANRLEQGQ